MLHCTDIHSSGPPISRKEFVCNIPGILVLWFVVVLLMGFSFLLHLLRPVDASPPWEVLCSTVNRWTDFFGFHCHMTGICIVLQ